MNLLIDTQAILWFIEGDQRLGRNARTAIEKKANTCFISMASWWEIAIKVRLNKLGLEIPLKEFIRRREAEGFRTLDIQADHVSVLTTLPLHHRDPFDRLIIAQARQDGMSICTCDDAFREYDVRVIW